MQEIGKMAKNNISKRGRGVLGVNVLQKPKPIKVEDRVRGCGTRFPPSFHYVVRLYFIHARCSQTTCGPRIFALLLASFATLWLLSVILKLTYHKSKVYKIVQTYCTSNEPLTIHIPGFFGSIQVPGSLTNIFFSGVDEINSSCWIEEK